eukprot:8622263-Pyramimonas_sp.AAC.1
MTVNLASPAVPIARLSPGGRNAADGPCQPYGADGPYGPSRPPGPVSPMSPMGPLSLAKPGPIARPMRHGQRTLGGRWAIRILRGFLVE